MEKGRSCVCDSSWRASFHYWEQRKRDPREGLWSSTGKHTGGVSIQQSGCPWEEVLEGWSGALLGHSDTSFLGLGPGCLSVFPSWKATKLYIYDFCTYLSGHYTLTKFDFKERAVLRWRQELELDLWATWHLHSVGERQGAYRGSEGRWLRALGSEPDRSGFESSFCGSWLCKHQEKPQMRPEIQSGVRPRETLWSQDKDFDFGCKCDAKSFPFIAQVQGDSIGIKEQELCSPGRDTARPQNASLPCATRCTSLS